MICVYSNYPPPPPPPPPAPVPLMPPLYWSHSVMISNQLPPRNLGPKLEAMYRKKKNGNVLLIKDAKARSTAIAALNSAADAGESETDTRSGRPRRLSAAPSSVAYMATRTGVL